MNLKEEVQKSDTQTLQEVIDDVLDSEQESGDDLVKAAEETDNGDNEGREVDQDAAWRHSC